MIVLPQDTEENGSRYHQRLGGQTTPWEYSIPAKSEVCWRKEFHCLKERWGTPQEWRKVELLVARENTWCGKPGTVDEDVSKSVVS